MIVRYIIIKIVFVLTMTSIQISQAAVGVLNVRTLVEQSPQAIILTAIVIGFATQALLSANALRLSRKFPLLRFKDLENDK